MRDRPLIESSVHWDCQQPVRRRSVSDHVFPQFLCSPGLLAAIAVACIAMLSFPIRAIAQQATSPVPATAANDASMETSNLPGIKDYLDTSEGPVEISSLGVEVRDGRASLGDGESISGAEVVDISPNSPAAEALGTHKVSHALIDGALIGAGVASVVLFPPALVAVAMMAHSGVGMSYDLVIGIDGYRVRNTIDLMQSVAGVRSGDTVYVAIVRGGHRLQIPVHVQ
jgi:S1-C subfamily serine protease